MSSQSGWFGFLFYFFSVTGTGFTPHPAQEALYLCVKGTNQSLQKGLQHKGVWGHQSSLVPAQEKLFDPQFSFWWS